MTAKLEWVVVGALGVACAGIYLATQRREQAPLPVAPATAAPAATPAEAPTPTASTPTEPAIPSPSNLLAGMAEQAGLKPTIPELPWIATTDFSTGLPAEGQWRGNPALADVNGDGKLDALASIRRIDSSTRGEGLFVFLGDGAGGWTTAIGGLRRDMGYGGVAVSDLNADGAADIAFSGHDVTPQVFLGGDPDGRWLLSWTAYDLNGISDDVALGDLDGDGRDDLASIAGFSDGDGLVVYRGDGEGRFQRWQDLEPSGSYGHAVEVVDLEGDGRNELIALTTEGPRVWAFDGAAWQDRSMGLPKPGVGGSEFGLAAVDLDGDGPKELLVAGFIYPGHEPVRAFRSGPNGWTQWGQGLPDGEGFFALAMLDLGPGEPISFVVSGAGGVQLVQQVSPGQFEPRGRLDGVSNVYNLACGDVDGDGRDEVLCSSAYGLRVLRLNETSFASAGASGGAPR